MENGFIIHNYAKPGNNGGTINLIGKLQTGETFAAVFRNIDYFCFIKEQDISILESFLEKNPGIKYSQEKSSSITMGRKPVIKISFSNTRHFSQFQEYCNSSSIGIYEGDFSPVDQFLINNKIHGSISIGGEWRKGEFVNRIYVNPVIEPVKWRPQLKILSFDIETNPNTDEILAIGLSTAKNTLTETSKEVLFWGQSRVSANITILNSEKALLQEFIKRIQKIDPDIITGWNIISFDLNKIFKRCSLYNIAVFLGRSREKSIHLGADTKNEAYFIQGRQIIDGIRLMRSAPERYESYSLEYISQSVLGTGKTLEQQNSESKIEAILRLYKEDPVSLCNYCLNDAELVLQILDKTKLLNLTFQRTMLLGVPLSRAWTSIAAFDFLYTEHLHKKGIVAPSQGTDMFPMERAPGGAILDPQAGIFENVYIFDFKSLYPTIIYTFNIDPLSYFNALSDENYLKAPNGAHFSRIPSILPEILKDLFKNREEAKKRNDTIASYVYKIIMNSFYGVLGARGSRFAISAVAGAITSFGQHLLQWARDFFVDQGYRVLYGDTDSLFVKSGLEMGTEPKAIEALGKELCSKLNSAISEYILETWQVNSTLELEFEKTYTSFFIPKIRTIRAGEESKGRAKGYAGKLLNTDKVEIKGMEAVRSDWTMAARNFQTELLTLLFNNTEKEAIYLFMKETIKGIRSGIHDNDLIYKKSLRKAPEEYDKTSPPHVKAARMLPKKSLSKTISYYLSKEGPVPIQLGIKNLDYDHYIQKQIFPIAEAVASVLEIDIEPLFSADSQMKLF